MSNIAFIDTKVEQAYQKLETGRGDERKLFVFIQRAISDIVKDYTVGIPIAKKLIPKAYAKYNLNNLWKYDLPDGWRLLYTVSGNHVQIIAIVVEWLDHTNYERRFGY